MLETIGHYEQPPTQIADIVYMKNHLANLQSKIDQVLSHELLVSHREA